VFFGQQEAVYRNNAVFPRAFFVGDSKVIPDDETMFNTITSVPDYEPLRYAYLSEEPPVQLQPVSDSVLADAKAELVHFGINSFAYDVETPEDAILKISEVWYPSGWTATLDGEPVDILRSDYTLRAVIIPAGAHRLEMHYEPRSYEAGLIVTTVTNYLLALVLLAYLVMYIRRRMQSGKGAAASEQSGE